MPGGMGDLEMMSLVIPWSALYILDAGIGEATRVRAARRGSRGAFDALVRAYERPLRGFLVQRVGREAADDVMQETLLAAWAALPHFGGRSRFKAWLFGIALHKVSDAQRAQHRASVLCSDMTEYQEFAGLDPFVASDLRHSVRGVLAELPPRQREVLELYYYAEMTLPEVAETLRRNLNTVKYQFYRAHALAADRLREYSPAGGEQQ